MSRLREDDVAIVTGAARGIGAETVRHLAAAGAAVVATDVVVPDGEIAENDDGRVIFQRLDVVRSAEWAAAVDVAERRFGPVTVLVNNAGILDWGGVTDMDEATFRRLLDVNTIGTFLGMKAVVASMTAAGHGAIVNISSTAGMSGSPHSIGYTASKWAVRGMTKSAALELAPRGIRVNSVHPGLIDTSMGSSGTGRIGLPPLGRMGAAADVARVVTFLASSDAAFVTGSEHIVDGGMLAGRP